ncbi:response regulator [Flavobacterium sp. WC2509]|uniref:response regulator n=1 Tax=Flavobacterium sp. WC2509 TaxID=3461406 RepID=UPI0040441DFF
MDNYILIVGDQLNVRSGTSILLEKKLNSVSAFEVHNFRDAFLACHTIIFDLVILDINLSFGRKCKVIETLRNLQKNVKIVMFLAQEENVYALRYIKAGANEFLNTCNNGNALVRAVEKVLE